MLVEKTLSGCIAVYNYASNSNLLSSLLVIIFILIPFIKVFSSILKTHLNLKKIESSCSQSLPIKLQKIINLHKLNSGLFLISCRKDFTAVSVGIITKRIVFSKNIIDKLSLKELESVVLHELYHTNFYHSAILFITELFAKTLFFFPLLVDIQEVVKLELEKSADKYAVSIQKTSKYLRRSLKKVIINNDYGFYPKFSYIVIENRINNLNNQNSNYIFNLKRLYGTLTVLLVFLVLLLLNNKYAMASTMEEKISCSVFECVKQCVSDEIISRPRMSENNLTIDPSTY